MEHEILPFREWLSRPDRIANMLEHQAKATPWAAAALVKGQRPDVPSIEARLLGAYLSQQADREDSTAG